jgi:uncharacterized protein YigE (DUF2233 family)
MKLNKLYLCAATLLVLAFAACKVETVAPTFDTRILGEWQNTYILKPEGSNIVTYKFYPDNTFTYTNYILGAYQGQALQDTSSYAINTGIYSAQYNNLNFQIGSITTWDKLNGMPPKQNVAPNGVSTVNYTIVKDTLTFTYYTYPADAPVLTTSKYYKLHK